MPKTFSLNILRDRLLMRLLSRSGREALETAVFYDIYTEIQDYNCRREDDRNGHVAIGLTYLASLVDTSNNWTAELDAA